MIFSSTNQLQFYCTSRRDDLISLCYLLIFLLRRGELPKLDIYAKVDRNESFKIIRDTKLAYKMKDLCNEQEGTCELKEFIREVFNYRFKDEPNYNKLRKLLQDLLMKHSPDSSSKRLTEAAELRVEQVKATEEIVLLKSVAPTPVNKKGSTKFSANSRDQNSHFNFGGMSENFTEVSSNK